MKIKLPVQTKEIKNGAMVKTQSEQEFDLDMSIAAQIRFETKFPALAEREDLLGYSQRIFEINDLSLGLIISKLKMIYCWFDTEMGFNDFLKLFDLSDESYMKKLIKAMNDTFEIVADGSAEKN